ncbi:hypothetical protein NQ117_06545 [Paenibacillus sp. SC116]|uniref:hypothetical protein n=1 Tax=Paenibacillus sp. SC116 TaxID=2968986 RepID=UPI00215B21D0|nr:hypothetical protein [Paenibacillus sp. SC116]MCR8843337.1 hypothetical protein [Paenibacillus sp. SC116]
MTITIKKYEITLGKKIYKVITTAEPVQDMYVLKTNTQGGIILGNETSLHTLENMFLLSSITKDSLVYFNTRSTEVTDYYLLDRWSIEDKGNDLVLLHHSIQFKTNDWKEIRNLIRKTKDFKIEQYDFNKNIDRKSNLAKYWYREHKDYLDIRENYETLFLIGSQEVFENISNDANSIKNEGRILYLQHPGYHAHEHIDYYERRQYTKNFQLTGWSLCLDFYDRQLWGR